MRQSVRDRGTLAPTLEHLGDDFGWVLEVGVDDNRDVAGRALQTGGNGGLMAEIAGQGGDAHMRIGALQFTPDLQRFVAAAVADIDALEVEIGDGFECGDEAAMGHADDRFLVEAGNDDGQESGCTSPMGWGWLMVVRSISSAIVGNFYRSTLRNSR